MNEEERRAAGKGSRLLGSERGCLGDFKPGKRLLSRGLQMHRQAHSIQHWLIYGQDLLPFFFLFLFKGKVDLEEEENVSLSFYI